MSYVRSARKSCFKMRRHLKRRFFVVVVLKMCVLQWDAIELNWIERSLSQTRMCWQIEWVVSYLELFYLWGICACHSSFDWSREWDRLRFKSHNLNWKKLIGFVIANREICRFVVITNFSYAEMKHSDWMFQVMWLVLTNFSAFQHSIATYNEICYMASTPDLIKLVYLQFHYLVWIQ